MTWLKYFGPLIQILAAAFRLWADRSRKYAGRLEAENAQSAQDAKMVRKATHARRAVRFGSDRVRRDPRNRDAH